MDIFIRLFVCFLAFILFVNFFTWVQQRSTVYVAVVAHTLDKTPLILGVYYRKEKAEAKIYQYSKGAHLAIYSEVIECQINPKRR